MAAIGVQSFVGVGLFTPPTKKRFCKPSSSSLAASTAPITAATTTLGVTKDEHKHHSSSDNGNNGGVGIGIAGLLDDDEIEAKRSWRDYFELAKVFIGSSNGGSPRWFSPLESGSTTRLHNSPPLLYLPGLDGLGLGLVLQHKKLGKIFDVWCLHIPIDDRTPFQELVLLVEQTVRSENRRCPERPIYLVGESVGGCLALAVAARNPDIDLVIILANPATCYSKSHLQTLLPLLEVVPSELPINLSYALGLTTGLQNGFEWQATLNQLFPSLGEMSSYITIMLDILPRETLLWKLQMMKSAGSFANSRLHAVKAQILILASGRDPLQSNFEEAERIHAALPKQENRVFKNSNKMPRCDIRKFGNSGHFLFLEDGVDLVSIIKGTSFYRRGKHHDYAADFLPLTNAEFDKTSEIFRWLNIAAGPVMLSTLENGKITRGLAGIPTEGPVILVGYHTFLGLELYDLVLKSMSERGIVVRGLAHPMFFEKQQEDDILDIAIFDVYRMMGAVPVSASNFYKLLSSHSHILLYPGGIREALHKKGEDYQLFWPERAEFVRMAARFGAKIVPFGVVGEDDLCEIVLDYDDQMKIPYLREIIEKRNNHNQLRTDSEGEVANQAVHFPGVLPKLPGRYYYLFGKPIDTAGMKLELRDREKAHELYLQVKSEVERCISYLKEKREKDPYRSLVARALYQTMNGSINDDEIPTFEL